MAAPRLMNNLILVIVLLAGLGILAALALGTYFALQPKGLGGSRSAEKVRSGSLYSPKFLFTPPPKNLTIVPVKTTLIFEQPSSTAGVTNGPTTKKARPTTSLGRVGPIVYEASDRTTQLERLTTTTTTPRPTTPAKTSPATKKATVEFARLVLPEDVENFVNGPGVQPERGPVISFPTAANPTRRAFEIETTTTPPTVFISPDERRIAISGHTEVRQRGELVPQESNVEDGALEKHLLGYQKIAGISYRNGYLYVPSYVNGKVSVLSTPDMNTLIEYDCDQCSIYDIGALSTGDMVAVLGRNQQMVKISPAGIETKRIDLDYATKGLAINGYNEIFVLSRSHREIYVYNKDLEAIALVKIPGKAEGDCNFLAVNDSDVVFVSCQEAVYVFTVNGDPVMEILPPRGVTYGVGMDLDNKGNILVVRRGEGILDVYDYMGRYVEAVGEGANTLWSDIAAGEEHLYVVDYIDAKIKVFKYV